MYRGLCTTMTWINSRVHLILRICKRNTACYGWHPNACPVLYKHSQLSSNKKVIWYPFTRTHNVLHQGHLRAQMRFAQFCANSLGHIPEVNPENGFKVIVKRLGSCDSFLLYGCVEYVEIHGKFAHLYFSWKAQF